MRYRKLDPDTGDYTFGQGQSNFWIDQPEAVAQSVFTRLMLFTGQWFLDLADGTDWQTQVLGERTRQTRDIVVRDRVLTTQGVAAMLSYGSVMDDDRRRWVAQMSIDTVYGPVALTAARMPAETPAIPGIDYPLAPKQQARLLGISSGVTSVDDRPADLTQPGTANIADFVIRTIDGGSFT